MKRIAILGSTGSIGQQTLNVIRRHANMFEVEVLCAGSNADILIAQAIEFMPNAVAIADERQYRKVASALAKHDIKVYTGTDSIVDIMSMDSIDIVVSAIVGFAGLKPTLKALECGKTVALANKETLVAAGSIVTEVAEKYRATFLPVDSEHSAIFQCLIGETCGIDKLILTASGGPFRGMKQQQLENISPGQALKHPNWNMGAKVSIDSATLMNKGLEVIEAHWLFHTEATKIKVLVHPQSIVHSMVQFVDGSIKAQIGIPTMETPIQYALTFPYRTESHLPRFDFTKNSHLTFEEPDRDTFPCLDLAYSALKKGGNMPCIMNAANEVAVKMFLHGDLPFLKIAEYVHTKMETSTFIDNPTLDDLIQTHQSICMK
ncbi:MAG: 1-deoxy-D-xylulose-5-phosphate reductoisomerase [Bacteroidales bacterium]|nr:1-deoxy-D-xylulose-5-phosphate reductoisomerase [Bacteroidales bacterium]